MSENKELLFSLTKKDFIVEYFKGSGAGGQHRNKTSSCCRITHPNSGASAVGTEHREQPKNKKLAFERLVKSPKFKIWINNRINGITNIEEEVNKSMSDENIKTQIFKDGKWIDAKDLKELE